MTAAFSDVKFSEFLKPNLRPYTLGPEEDANLLGVRWYGQGPFHRELKPAMQIAKKSHFVVKAGDIIYNKLFAWKGTFGIVPDNLDGMFVSDKFPTYTLDRSKVDERFLSWYFRYPPLWESARAMSTGSAAISKLTLNPPKFLLLTVPLPPFDEQQRIAELIEVMATQLLEANTLRQQAKIQAEAIVKSVLRRISEEIKPKGQLDDVLAVPPRNGWSAKCDNAYDGIPVLSLGAVTGFRYRSTEFKRTSLHARGDGHFWLNTGDLLITRSNTPELVGHAAIYDGNPSPCIYPDLMMKLTIDINRAYSRFVWYWLQSATVREFIYQNAKGTSPTMKKISQKTVMKIPFPSDLPLPEQHRIVKELDALRIETDALLHLQATTSVECDALLPSILDRAFRGEL